MGRRMTMSVSYVNMTVVWADEEPYVMQKNKLQEGQASCTLSGCDLKARLGLEQPSSEHGIRELSMRSPAAPDCIADFKQKCLSSKLCSLQNDREQRGHIIGRKSTVLQPTAVQ